MTSFLCQPMALLHQPRLFKIPPLESSPNRAVFRHGRHDDCVGSIFCHFAYVCFCLFRDRIRFSHSEKVYSRRRERELVYGIEMQEALIGLATSSGCVISFGSVPMAPKATEAMEWHVASQRGRESPIDRKYPTVLMRWSSPIWCRWLLAIATIHLEQPSPFSYSKLHYYLPRRPFIHIYTECLDIVRKRGPSQSL